MNVLENAWQKILRDEFPNVIVRQRFDVDDPRDLVCDVLMVPDEDTGEVMDFVLKNAVDISDQKQIPCPVLLPVCVSQTLELYPEIVAEEAARIAELAIQNAELVPA